MATLQEAVSWVKDALGRKKGVVESMGFYCIVDRTVMATDGNFTAGHPADVTVRTVAAGDALESALSVMGSEIKVEIDVDSKKLVLRSGKSKASINTLPLDSWGGVRPLNDWKPAPAGLSDAVKLVKSFVAANATKLWQAGVSVCNGYVMAMNPAQLSRAEMAKQADFTRNVILPPYACDFLVSHGQPAEWQVNESYVAFRWESGAWMRTQLIADELPDIVSQIIDRAGDAEHAVTDELRAAIMKAAKVTDGSDPISIYADRVEGGGKNIDISDAATCVVPPEKYFGGGLEARSIWAKDVLEPVLELATHINWHQWPDAAAWKGQGVRGCLMGRRA